MKIELEIDITSLVIGAAIGIIVGVGIMLALGCRDSGNVSGRTPHEVLPPDNEEYIGLPDYPELADYLNNHLSWKRSDLACIPHGVEFFDVLNDGDSVEELQEWCDRLSPDVEKVRRIQTLLTAKFGSSDWSGKRIVFRDGNNKYDVSNNKSMTPERYISALERMRLIGNELKRVPTRGNNGAYPGGQLNVNDDLLNF